VNAPSMSPQRSHPITRIGPFRLQGSGAWLFPCAVLSLSGAVVGYLWLAAVAVLSSSLTCTMQLPMSVFLGAMLGVGAGFLLATAFGGRASKFVVIAFVFAAMGGVGFLAADALYALRCQSSIPLVRQLLIGRV
jgi:hypothetical protein